MSAGAPGRSPRAGRGDRAGVAVLVVLAALLPAGALLQPRLLPSRSALPVVDTELVVPVVIVTAGALRADRVGHLSPREGGSLTPSLDRLAETGITFTNAFSNSNDELVSTAMLLTGACSGKTGVHGARDELSPEPTTLAERFARRGYHTIAVVANPRLLGHGLQRGFDVFEERPRAPARAVFAEALLQLERAPDERWLLWVDLGDLLPPYGGEHASAALPPDAPQGFGDDPGSYYLSQEDWAARGWGSRHARWLAARYDAAVSALDAALGGFLAELERQNRLETLYLAFAGTSGTRLDDRGDVLFAHAVDLFDPSLRVPLLFRMPGQYVRGLPLDGPAMTVDVGPALGEMALRRGWKGAPQPTLSKIVEYQQRGVPRRVVAEGPVRAPHAEPWTGYVVRTADSKVIVDRDGARSQAFLLPADAAERDPRPLGDAQQRYVLEEVQRWLDQCAW